MSIVFKNFLRKPTLSSCLIRYASTGSADVPRVLITGGLGQLGPGLAEAFALRYGKENVVISDINKPSKEFFTKGFD